MQTQITYREVTESISVEVHPFYVDEQSDPSRDYYFYAYRIRITNLGESTCQLLSRHWIIRNGKSQEEHVTGEGVVGQKPILHPAETFEYTSFCPLNTPTGNMRGSFEMVTEKPAADGPVRLHFNVKVPVFFFRRPETFH